MNSPRRAESTYLVFVVLLALLFSACSGLERRDSAGLTPLYRAAEKGDLREVRNLIEEGADLESWNGYLDDTPAALKWVPGRKYSAGYRPLHVAVAENHPRVVEYLLINRADANARDRKEQTPLGKAASLHGDVRMVKLLVKNGADVDVVDRGGFTPIITAARNGHAALVRYLLSKGALVNRRTLDGWTALHFAAFEGNREVAAALLSQGAEMVETPTDGQLPLQLAVLRDRQGVVEELLKRGADPNQHASGTSPLVVAAAYDGRSEVVRLLLEYGARADETSAGMTALMHAATNNHAEVITALIQCGADVDGRDPESPRTALQHAVLENAAEAVKALLEGGADPDATLAPESPPLARAAREGYLEIVKLLLLHGADINIDDHRWTPLRLAEFGGHQSVADYLSKGGGVHEPPSETKLK